MFKDIESNSSCRVRISSPTIVFPTTDLRILILVGEIIDLKKCIPKIIEKLLIEKLDISNKELNHQEVVAVYTGVAEFIWKLYCQEFNIEENNLEEKGGLVTKIKDPGGGKLYLKSSESSLITTKNDVKIVERLVNIIGNIDEICSALIQLAILTTKSEESANYVYLPFNSYTRISSEPRMERNRNRSNRIDCRSISKSRHIPIRSRSKLRSKRRSNSRPRPRPKPKSRSSRYKRRSSSNRRNRYGSPQNRLSHSIRKRRRYRSTSSSYSRKDSRDNSSFNTSLSSNSSNCHIEENNQITETNNSVSSNIEDKNTNEVNSSENKVEDVIEKSLDSIFEQNKIVQKQPNVQDNQNNMSDKDSIKVGSENDNQESISIKINKEQSTNKIPITLTSTTSPPMTNNPDGKSDSVNNLKYNPTVSTNPNKNIPITQPVYAANPMYNNMMYANYMMSMPYSNLQVPNQYFTEQQYYATGYPAMNPIYLSQMLNPMMPTIQTAPVKSQQYNSNIPSIKSPLSEPLNTVEGNVNTQAQKPSNNENNKNIINNNRGDEDGQLIDNSNQDNQIVDNSNQDLIENKIIDNKLTNCKENEFSDSDSNDEMICETIINPIDALKTVIDIIDKNKFIPSDPLDMDINGEYILQIVLSPLSTCLLALFLYNNRMELQQRYQCSSRLVKVHSKINSLTDEENRILLINGSLEAIKKSCDMLMDLFDKTNSLTCKKTTTYKTQIILSPSNASLTATGIHIKFY